MTKEAEAGSSQSPPPRRKRTARRVLTGVAWVAGGLAAAGIVAVLLLMALVNLDGVHRYLLSLAQEKAGAALGVPVSIENFRVDIPALRVDLYGVSIAGAKPYRTPPLLQVNHIEASVRIVSIFNLQWYLSNIEVDHPVAWIIEGKDGTSNIPTPRGGGSRSNLNLFSVSVHHALLSNGEIYFNDRPNRIDASLADLKVQAGYNSRYRFYNGTLAYTIGQLQIGTNRPLPHRLRATFRLTPESLTVTHASLTSGRSRLAIDGTITDFSRPTIRAHYDATIDGGQIRTIMHQEWAPAGLVRVKGSILYRRMLTKPAMQALTVKGDASSKALWITTRGRTISITAVTADYSLANGIVTLQRLHAHLLGGDIAAQAKVAARIGNRHGTARLELHNLSLSAAERIFLSRSPRPVALTGNLNGNASASWGATFKDLAAKADVMAQGDLTPQAVDTGRQSPQARSAKRAATSGAGVPVQAEMHASYSGSNSRLELVNTFLRAPGTHLVLGGAIGKRSSLKVSLQLNDLGETATLASLFAAKDPASRLRALGLGGKASFQGNISGTLSSPEIGGRIEGSNLSVNGSRWKSLQAYVRFSPKVVEIENGYLMPASQGSIHFSATGSLDHWGLNRAAPIEAALHISSVRASDLLRLAKQTIPVKGILNADVQLHGSAATPAGKGHIELTGATIYQQPVDSASANFVAADGTVTGSSIVKIAGGQLKAKAMVRSLQRTYSGQITSAGVRIGRLQIVKSREANAEGILALKISGNGSFANPELTGDISISRASIQGHAVSEAHLQVSLANRIVLAELSSRVSAAQLEAQARVALTGSYPAELSLNTQMVSLQPLLALYAPAVAKQVSGETEVHMELSGPLKERQALVGSITIPFLRIAYDNKVRMAATAPIQINYKDGILRVQPSGIQGTDTDLRVQGAIPIYSQAPFSFQISGGVNLEMAQLLDPELRSSGIARIDIRSGNKSNGGLAGQIDIKDASLSSVAFPVGLQNGNGTLTLTGDRIDVTRFNGTIGGGTVTAQGGVSLRPKLAFDLGMTAKNVRMLYPQGMRETLNASLRFTGSTERALLGGSVGISGISFAPSFDLISMVSQFSSGVSTPTAPGFSQNLFLNIAVNSTNVLAPSSRTMSVAGTAALMVRGTAANPALIGRVNLTGGNMIYNGDRFVLLGGTIQFVNPNQIRPVLNVSLKTTIQQYDIRLRFAGPAEQMRTEFTSNPSLPQADIIHLLAFGTTTEAQAAPANQMAESMIASQVSSSVTSRISKIAGISQLSISPVLTSGTAAGPPGAVITIRQQVTGNLFVTFSTNVASTQSETVQGEYKLTPRVSVSATRDPNGGFAVDALIKKSW